MENELIEVDIAPITLEKRKRGGQPGNTNALHHGAPRGNSNALVHGFYSVLNRNPYSETLQSARRLSSPRWARQPMLRNISFLPVSNL